MKTLYKDERGVEPNIMKLLVGVVLVAIGLGIGVTIYKKMDNSGSKALNYEVTVTPTADEISKGKIITVSIDVNSPSNYDKSVELSSTGDPDNVVILFSPTSGKPDFGSTMTIAVGDQAPTGTHTITVKGISDDDEKSATFDLTIQ